MDLLLYDPTGRYHKTLPRAEEMDPTTPDSLAAQGLEVIAGKVVKFLLTSLGSDAYNPEYGGVALHHTQISVAFIPQLTMQLHADIEKCVAFLKKADAGLSGERLSHVTLRDVLYTPHTTPDRLDVRIEVVTTLGRRAVVSLARNPEGVWL